MPGHARRRYTTYLVTLATGREPRGAGGPVVYAVMKGSAEEALEAVRAFAGAPADGEATVVGSLSTRTAKAIKLKPDEVRAV